LIESSNTKKPAKAVTVLAVGYYASKPLQSSSLPITHEASQSLTGLHYTSRKNQRTK